MNALTVLNSEDQKVYDSLLDECRDSWRKRQVFRTETEMRLSVLNEGKHPTAASKYWQAVREQSVFFDNVMVLSFEYRRNVIKLEQKKVEREELVEAAIASKAEKGAKEVRRSFEERTTTTRSEATSTTNVLLY